MRRVVLDVDTGIDDALAILYAVASPDVELCGVTTVVGNVSADVAARNSLAVLARAGVSDVPVAVGATRTLSGAGPREDPTNHGPDGLGGVRVPIDTETSYGDPAALLRSAAVVGPVTLVGLAPLTNVAELAGTATDVVLVAGELRTEEPPELNAGHDPLATTRVLAGVLAPTLYVAEVFEQVSVSPADVARLRSAPHRAARLAGDLLAVRRSHLVGDAGALVLLTHPHLFRVEAHQMGLAGGHLTRTHDGRLLDVVVGVDAAAVATAYVETLLAH